MRILLYTGTGGVAKTSSRAASALRYADLCYRTAVLSIPRPRVTRIWQLHRRGVDELIVRIDNWKCNIPLFNGLAKLDIHGVRHEEHRFNIYFALNAETPALSPQELKPAT